MRGEVKAAGGGRHEKFGAGVFKKVLKKIVVLNVVLMPQCF